MKGHLRTFPPHCLRDQSLLNYRSRSGNRRKRNKQRHHENQRGKKKQLDTVLLSHTNIDGFRRNSGLGHTGGSLDFGLVGAARVVGLVSYAVGTVGRLDRRVGALVATFADGIRAGVGGGGVCRGTDGANRREGEPFFIVAEGLAVVVLSVREDEEVVLQVAPGVEEVEGAEVEGLVVEGPGDGKDDGGLCLGSTGFGLEEPARCLT